MMQEMELSEAEIAEIGRHSRDLDAIEPRIARVWVEGERLVIALKGSAFEGATLSFPARNYAPLVGVSAEQLAQVVVTGSGSSVRWPEIGVGIGAPALVRLACGLAESSLTAHQPAVESVRSEVKANAVRANGAKGGRPRKVAA